MQLRPQEVFTIVRGLENHTDSTTYYVRAVVRNARTDATLDAVNLVDQGDGHRFAYNYTVPSDTSGAGFYISITTSVYSDSGYTAKTSNYGDSFDTFLVQERTNPNLGNGGGIDIDYKKIQKMIAEEIKKIPLPEIEMPAAVEMPEVNLQPLMTKIEECCRMMRDMKMPEMDLSPVMANLGQIKKQITEIEMPEMDLSPVIDSIDEQKIKWEDVSQQMGDVLERIKPFFAKDVEDIKDLISKLHDKLGGIAYVTLPPVKEKEPVTDL